MKRKIIIAIGAVIAVASILVFLFFKFFHLTIPELKEFTRSEKEYIKKASKNMECEVIVDKSYAVEVNNQSHGTLYLTFDCTGKKDGICNRDSAFVSTVIHPIANSFEKVMDKRRQYDSLIILVISMNRQTPGMEYESCKKSFSFLLDDMTKYTYAENHD